MNIVLILSKIHKREYAYDEHFLTILQVQVYNFKVSDKYIYILVDVSEYIEMLIYT